jgi:hypothetical protein
MVYNTTRNLISSLFTHNVDNPRLCFPFFLLGLQIQRVFSKPRIKKPYEPARGQFGTIWTPRFIHSTASYRRCFGMDSNTVRSIIQSDSDLPQV